MQELREKRGLVYGVEAAIDSYAGHAHVLIGLYADAARMREIVAITADVLRDMTSGGITAGELATAKRQIELWDGLDLGRPDARIADICAVIVAGGTLDDRYVRAAQIREAGYEMITGIGHQVFTAPPVIIGNGPVCHMPKPAEICAVLAGDTLRAGPQKKSFFRLAG